MANARSPDGFLARARRTQARRSALPAHPAQLVEHFHGKQSPARRPQISGQGSNSESGELEASLTGSHDEPTKKSSGWDAQIQSNPLHERANNLRFLVCRSGTRRARGALIVLFALFVAVTAHASSAYGDGDPASDVLLAQDVFYPYQPSVSPALSAVMNKVLLEANHGSLKLKVAIIGSPEDLGAVFDLFGHPQQYAQFLDREISFNHRQSLLVVMPAGFGGAALGPSAGALNGLRIDDKHSSYGLTRSAILAVVALARAGGRMIAMPSIPSEHASRAGGGPPTLLLFGAPVLLLILGGLAIRQRRMPV
jgi:hypothetical protein